MIWVIVIGLAGAVLYLGASLRGARAENAELIVLNARLKRRLARGAR